MKANDTEKHLAHGLSQMYAILVLFIYAYSNVNRWPTLQNEFEKYEKEHSKNS